MSRLGKKPIVIPEKIEVTIAEGVLTVKGPKGELTRTIVPLVSVTVADGSVTLTPTKDTKQTRMLWGTYAAHLRNMFEGVTTGFTKVLEIEGVGYRAEVQGSKMKLAVGLSHPIELPIPDGIKVTTEKGIITLSGIDKEVVGQFAADIRGTKPPEPYKGKGIHYQGEYIIRKQGKKGVA